MSKEILEQKEISQEDWRRMTAEAEKYFQKGMELREGDPSVSLQHISGNLLTLIEPGYLAMINSDLPDQKIRVFEEAIHIIEYLRRYFALLDEFPEFRAGEMSHGNGYFSDPAIMSISADKLVEIYERRLRGEKKEQSRAINEAGV